MLNLTGRLAVDGPLLERLRIAEVEWQTYRADMLSKMTDEERERFLSWESCEDARMIAEIDDATQSFQR